MYDEHKQVLSSLRNIRNNFQDTCIILCHSYDKESSELQEIKKLVNKYYHLPNLGTIYNRFELPSYAISRNYSLGFSTFYSLEQNTEYIVAFTGDTVITDATNFDRLYKKIKSRGAIAAVSQAIGQSFHAVDSNPLLGKCGGRYQHMNIADFSCSIFIIDGEFACQHKTFASIPITNKYTSEQCLGDELSRCTGPDFHKKVIRLNEDNVYYSYNYSDGIIYHQHTDTSRSKP
jgi:hypothetical protein